MAPFRIRLRQLGAVFLWCVHLQRIARPYRVRERSTCGRFTRQRSTIDRLRSNILQLFQVLLIPALLGFRRLHGENPSKLSS